MADRELLTFKQPGASGAEITLHQGDWEIFRLELGTPAQRDELVAAADTDGMLPMRLQKRDAVEWMVELRMVPQPDMATAQQKLRALEQALATAEPAAAAGPTDPAEDLARLIWSPAGSSRTGILPLITAEIRELPKEVTGEDAGWFLSQPAPVVRIGGLRDPFIYGPLTEIEDATLTGPGWAHEIDIPATGGSAPPWLKVSVTEETSIDRNRIDGGLEVPAGSDPLVINADDLELTGFQGAVTGDRLTCTSTEWVGAASTGPLTHRGTYRLVALMARGAGSIRVRYGITGQPHELTRTVELPPTALGDVDLGAIVVDRDTGGSWTGVIETTGTVSFGALLLVPTESWFSAETQPAGSALGTKVVDGSFTQGSTSLHGLALSVPAGQSWQVLSGSWSVGLGQVSRTAVSESSRQIALAGSSSYAGVAVTCDVTAQRNFNQDLLSEMGIVLRYVDASNMVLARIRRGMFTGGRYGWGIGLDLLLSGTLIPLVTYTQGQKLVGPIEFFGEGPGIWWGRIGCQIDTQGRWQLSWVYPSADALGQDLGLPDQVIAAGQHPALASGGALETGKVGLSDRWWQSTAMARLYRAFRAYGSPLTTEPILPADAALEITPAGMVTVNGATRTRVNHRGGILAPPPNEPSRLLVTTRRYAGVVTSHSEGQTDSQTVIVEARKRWLQVPE